MCFYKNTKRKMSVEITFRDPKRFERVLAPDGNVSKCCRKLFDYERFAPFLCDLGLKQTKQEVLLVQCKQTNVSA